MGTDNERADAVLRQCADGYGPKTLRAASISIAGFGITIVWYLSEAPDGRARELLSGISSEICSQFGAQYVIHDDVVVVPDSKGLAGLRNVTPLHGRY